MIVAMADWLLGLKVKVRCESTSDLLYTNCKGEEPIHLLVIMITHTGNTSTGTQLQCIGKIYRLSDVTENFQSEDAAIPNMILSGRVPYETALSDTFGQDFGNLMMLREAFGAAIGCASSIYFAIYSANDGVPLQWLRDCSIYSLHSFGPDFAHFIRHRFPELQPLRKLIQVSAVKNPIQQALLEFEVAMARIRVVCGCRMFCQADEDKTGFVYHEERGRFCLIVLTYTIIKMARSLTCIETDLAPMRAGLEEMYNKTACGLGVCGPRFNPPFRLLSAESIIEVQRSCRPEREQSLLEVAETIFGGHRRTYDVPPESLVSAFSENGLCYLYGILKDPFSGDNKISRVHVIPGRIEHKGRTYKMLSDGGKRSSPCPGQGRISPAVPESPLEDVESSRSGHLEVLITEHIGATRDDLKIQYGVIKNDDVVAWLGPARVVLAVSNNSGLAKCPRDEPFNQIPDLMSKVGRAFDQGSATCALEHGAVAIRGDDMATRLTALHSLWQLIVQGNQCLSCCLRHGISQGRPDFYIIVSVWK